MEIQTVQRWVMTALLIVTSWLLAAGLVAASLVAESDSAEPGLVATGVVVGVAAVAASLAIHGRRMLSPWLVLGIVPALLTWWIILR